MKLLLPRGIYNGNQFESVSSSVNRWEITANQSQEGYYAKKMQSNRPKGRYGEVGLMPVPYNSVAIANRLLEAHGKDAGIEHMKLQKLVYCAYGWWLAHAELEGRRLTSDGPEIWKHGPVFPDLYHAFKVFGRKPITQMQSTNPFAAPANVDANDEEIRPLITWIWGRYGHLSSFELSDMTHKQGTPWFRVAEERGFSVQMSTRIPDEYILEEFSGLMVKERQSQNPAPQADAGEAVAP